MAMHGLSTHHDLFKPNNFHYGKVNNTLQNGSQKNFIYCLQNIRHTLGHLERSLSKSNKYEIQLLQCKNSHNHSHDGKWWESQSSKSATSISKTNTSTTLVDNTESWSTMGIACLQYKYDELSRRYDALLREYDKRSWKVILRDFKLQQWRQRAAVTHAQIVHAHKTLLSVGEKYLALKKKRNTQKSRYEKQLNNMRKTLHDVVEAAETARLQFDARLADYLANESDSNAALLLYEIRKCNLLCLENTRLKGLLEKRVHGIAK